jgi:hypothetical protein
LRQRTHHRVEGVPRDGRGDRDRAAGAGLISLRAAQVHQQALIRSDDVAEVEAVQVVGAQAAFHPTNTNAASRASANTRRTASWWAGLATHRPPPWLSLVPQVWRGR